MMALIILISAAVLLYLRNSAKYPTVAETIRCREQLWRRGA